MTLVDKLKENTRKFLNDKKGALGQTAIGVTKLGFFASYMDIRDSIPDSNFFKMVSDLLAMYAVSTGYLDLGFDLWRTFGDLTEKEQKYFQPSRLMSIDYMVIDKLNKKINKH